MRGEYGVVGNSGIDGTGIWGSAKNDLTWRIDFQDLRDFREAREDERRKCGEPSMSESLNFHPGGSCKYGCRCSSAAEGRFSGSLGEYILQNRQRLIFFILTFGSTVVENQRRLQRD